MQSDVSPPRALPRCHTSVDRHPVRHDVSHARIAASVSVPGVPGGLCEDCHQLYIDPDMIELLDLGDGRCVFAIESDLVVQEQA